MRINKDWIDILFEHGVDKANRRIFLFEDVSETSIGLVIKALYLMDSEKQDPIELFVGSFGGCEYSMFGLYDAIQTLNSPVHTIAIGKCMSAAPLLVACGEKGQRYATPHTSFMVHEGWDELGVKRYDEIENDLKHFKELGEAWYKLMVKHTKKPITFWKSQCGRVGDKFFNAEKALEWGIIDQIWCEK